MEEEATMIDSLEGRPETKFGQVWPNVPQPHATARVFPRTVVLYLPLSIPSAWPR